ncbi:hypothetical protein PI125_g18823 [Phytophthora idaei]|nr:hypothetical protein PI125_g18823 [Phytophthora idaei]
MSAVMLILQDRVYSNEVRKSSSIRDHVWVDRAGEYVPKRSILQQAQVVPLDKFATPR